MTRFRELERIERAVETGVESELLWAASYCETRLSTASLRRHDKTWRDRLAKVRERLDALVAQSSRPR